MSKHHSTDRPLEPDHSAAETNGSIMLSVDLPGVEEKDVMLHVEDSYLKLKAFRSMPLSNPDSQYLRRTQPFGHISLQVRLPDDADQRYVVAKLDRGVLTIMLPVNEQPSSSCVSPSRIHLTRIQA